MYKLSYILIFFVCTLYGQTQIKIDWPSLAYSPWPVIRGDMQGTSRSEFPGPKTNNVIWESDLPLGILYGPVVGYDNILYFGTNSFDTDSNNDFYAYYPNGKIFWKNESGSSLPNRVSPLVASDSTVYMRSGSGEIFSFKYNGDYKWKIFIGTSQNGQLSIDRQGNLYTYGSDTIWKISQNGIILSNKFFPKIKSDFVFSLDGKVIYFNSGYFNPVLNEKCYLNAADLSGNIIWRHEFNENFTAAPAIDNQGNLYIYGSDSLNQFYFYSLSPSDSIRWKYSIAGVQENSAAAIDKNGNIIFYCRREKNAIPYLISIKSSGQINWESIIDPENPESYPDHNLVCDSNGNIFFGSTWGQYFYAFSNTGSLIWKIPLNGYEYDSGPAIGSDGTLYLGLNKGLYFQNHKKNLIAIRDKSVKVARSEIPDSYILQQNYPNPFNSETIIYFTIPTREFVRLKISDLLGREVVMLVDEEKDAGGYNVKLDGTNLSSGIYFYTLKAGKYSATKKIILLK